MSPPIGKFRTEFRLRKLEEGFDEGMNEEFIVFEALNMLRRAEIYSIILTQSNNITCSIRAAP